MTDSPRRPRKTTAKRRPASVKPAESAPPLDAVDTPAPPRKKTASGRSGRSAAGYRRGATAPPGPADLLALRARERMAVELAAAGVNDWDQIAQMCGYENRSAAWKAVHRVLNRQEFAAVADYRALVGYRYERILRANWTASITEDESVAKDKATPRVLRALEGLRRTFGLDLEAEKLAEALRIPETEAERAADLTELRDDLRRLTLVEGGSRAADAP